MATSAQPSPDNPIATLTPGESWELLGTQKLGRLVVHIRDRIEVFPVNFVTNNGKVVFLTAEGSKLADLTVFPDVAFEADHVAAESAWSVVVHGIARRLDKQHEIAEADELPLYSWIPTPKYNYVEITPTEISGRRMHLERHD